MSSFTESHVRDGKGGRVSFCKLEKLEREVTVSISHPKVPSSNPERGDFFHRLGDFLFFNQLFAFGFKIKGRAKHWS